MICSIENCSKEELARGWCSTHYWRWHRTGDPTKVTIRQRPTCSMEGCGKPHFAHGLCNAHYSRLRRHGDTLVRGTAPREALTFYRDVALSYGGEDCLLWPYSTKGPGRGYPQININGRPCSVHRLVCEQINGSPPSDVHQAAHNCGNSLCVNPRHMRWATPRENMADTIAHGTRANMGMGPRMRKAARLAAIDARNKSE